MAEERLWAPWRLEYIKGPKADECIFCAGPAAGDDPGRYIVERGEHCFAILNAFPYANGHLMISPYRHVPSIEELDEPTLTELMTMAQAALGALRRAYAPEGFNLGINQGKIAGAGVEHHVHLHVVPRWGADTNFMPVIGSTRVLPQSLDDSYRDVTEAFRAASA
ncbi:MAG TPA: HIT domain-containing protein [Thermoleophilaceae bacterium]|jgi:ATP adenylyltransferase